MIQVCKLKRSNTQSPQKEETNGFWISKSEADATLPVSRNLADLTFLCFSSIFLYIF